MLENTYHVAFLRLLNVFSTYSLKVVQIWFVWHETWHTTLISIYYCFEMVIIENNNQMLETSCYVVFISFLKLFLALTCLK